MPSHHTHTDEGRIDAADFPVNAPDCLLTAEPGTFCGACSKVGKKDTCLIHEALRLADGANIHRVQNLIGLYNSCFSLRDKGKLTSNFCRILHGSELELRALVTEARLSAIPQHCGG